MSISSTVKKVMPYLKTASGYVLHRLSSQAVEMDDGTTLEQKVTSLNSLISNKVDTSDVVNNCLTTESGFVLDGRQGKELNDKITELNGKLNPPLITWKDVTCSSITLKPNDSYTGTVTVTPEPGYKLFCAIPAQTGSRYLYFYSCIAFPDQNNRIDFQITHTGYDANISVQPRMIALFARTDYTYPGIPSEWQ